MKLLRCFFFPILCFIIILAGLSFAQQEENNFLGISFGISDFHIKDDRASPLIFSSIGIAPTLQYIHKGEVSRHYFEASYFNDYLTTSSDNFHSDNNRGRVRYSYVHYITDFKIFNDQMIFFLGGSVGTFLCHSDYYHQWIPPETARTIESWYWNNSLDLSAHFEYNLAHGGFLTLQFFMPIVSNISRPNYSPSGDYNYTDNDWKFKMFGDTEFFWENFSLNSILTY